MILDKKKYVLHISAGGFVLYKNKILLVKSLFHGGIIPPHGHVEKGETYLQTAMREICEETGYCHLKPILKLSSAHYQYFHQKKLHKKIEHRWAFELLDPKRQKKQTEEAKKLRNIWYTIPEALEAATFENTKKHIQTILSWVEKKK